MAAVAIGMFVGAWVLGPFFNRSTHDRGPLDSAASLQQTIYEASLRPDPSPYRTPTPVFEKADTHYAAAAKERAQASSGSRDADGSGAAADLPEALRELPADETPAPRRRASSVDRHTGVRY